MFWPSQQFFSISSVSVLRFFSTAFFTELGRWPSIKSSKPWRIRDFFCWGLLPIGDDLHQVIGVSLIITFLREFLGPQGERWTCPALSSTLFT
jgi:hypothetical protein